MSKRIQILYSLLTVILAHSLGARNFVADVNSIRNAVATSVDGKPALFISELAGGVACYTMEGQKLWAQATDTPAVMFEIEAFDIDGDERDELLAASADGHIYCWNNEGHLRWSFSPGYKVRFSEVAVLRQGGKTRVFAGGNNFKLYELDEDGKLLSTTPIKGVVRKIEAGNFLKKDEPSVFLMTYAHDKFRWEFMGLLDPQTKRVQKSVTDRQLPTEEWSSLMVTDLSVGDIDEDGLEDLLFFGAPKRSKPVFIALNGELKEIARYIGNSKDSQRYAHLVGASLLPSRKEIVMQYGGLLYVCDLKGNLLHKTGERYRGIIYNDLILEPESKQLIGAGQIGGGNGIYTFDLKSRNWWQADHKLQGRLLEVEKNMDTLYRQVLNFTPPTYQNPSEDPWVMITSAKMLPEVNRLKHSDILFVKQYTWHEDFDRTELVKAIGEDALKKDGRGNYKWSRQEIVEIAREQEAQGKPFAAWAGHGNDPWYLSLETIEAILEAAPTTCHGFVYAEMANPEDPRYNYFIDHDIPRIAKACRKAGKAKLYFRYKNVFWAASSHQEPWKRLFFSGKYNDILVPSAEDTNSRTQDINFVGRVGMLSAGYIDNFAIRLVDDNPTCWRPLSPGGQRSASPYVRNGAILAAYGARYGLLFNIGYLEEPGLNILFALMKSGVLPVVKKEDILSIGSWLLMQDVDEAVIHDIDDGHTMTLYTPDDENAVFSVGKINWAGASLPGHDFSRFLGVDYRWLNFIPEMPNGMIPVAPIGYASQLDRQDVPYAVSDCRVGFVDGKSVPAKKFGRTLASTVEAGAAKLPILVSGASWSAIRLDESHVRLVLVDPGYIDPQERAVQIRFQHKQPRLVRDILSGKKLSVSGNNLQLTVPAGSMRFIDLAY